MAPVSLECPRQSCTLGDDGARYKTPELESTLAMQMLTLHNDEHKQPEQVREVNHQNRKAEKVSRPKIKWEVVRIISCSSSVCLNHTRGPVS